MSNANNAGVGTSKKKREPGPPPYDYRKKTQLVKVLVSMLGQFLVAFIGSIAIGWITAYLLRAPFGLFDQPVDAIAGVVADTIWPLISVFFLWTVFDVRNHVRAGEGAYVTMSILGGVQLSDWTIPYTKIRIKGLRFVGEVSTFPWIRTWKHGYGGNTRPISCPSAFVRRHKGNNKDFVEVKASDNSPAKLVFAWIPLHPFKGVRRVAQEGPAVMFDNLDDIADAILKEALQDDDMDMYELMDSSKLSLKLRKAFVNYVDDEGKTRCHRMKVGSRMEYVIDTGYGLGIYNVQPKDIGPPAEIRKEFANKVVRSLAAEGRGEAFRKGVEEIRRAQITNPELSEDVMAMIILEQLSGEEVKLWKGNFGFGRAGESLAKGAGDLAKALKDAGFDPQTIERIIRSFADAIASGANAVQAVAAGGMARGGKSGGPRKRAGGPKQPPKR